jgi:hypothetical protein
MFDSGWTRLQVRSDRFIENVFYLGSNGVGSAQAQKNFDFEWGHKTFNKLQFCAWLTAILYGVMTSILWTTSEVAYIFQKCACRLRKLAWIGENKWHHLQAPLFRPGQVRKKWPVGSSLRCHAIFFRIQESPKTSGFSIKEFRNRKNIFRDFFGSFWKSENPLGFGWLLLISEHKENEV